MNKSRIEEAVDGVKLQFGYVETDPSGRYGRFRDVLGKGAMKRVYKAFDEVLGMEVAWNQVKLTDVFRSPEEVQRLYSEVHLLNNLSHSSIIRFHAYWVDLDRRTFNFITEMFTSGTLREYRQRYKWVSMRAIKNWARQILEGLAYLHCHDPPVIHRDLKCDNIFVNGHLAEVKIGDLGLAAILRGSSHHAHSVIGTPEFMAPELYEEDYDELVDIYSFGMCVLEMLTSEYPYSECSNPAQIYKKVTSGKLPEAFYRIQDAEAQEFIGKCLQPAAKRPSARDLLLDSFLAGSDQDVQLPLRKIPSHKIISDRRMLEIPPSDDHPKTTDMSITGTMNAEEDTIFLKVQISDKHGKTRNIFFPFDISSDTAMDVALEMVEELDISDWKPHEIAEMIDEEIKHLVPQFLQQYSFNYLDDDDDNVRHPFYPLSTHSSSEASLTGLLASCQSKYYGKHTATAQGYDWSQEDIKNFDDTSSESSLNSFKLSNMNYCSVHEKDEELSSNSRTKDLHYTSSSKCNSRFGPQQIPDHKCNEHNNVLNSSESICGLNPILKLTRPRSLMDIRSQLLHQTIMEEINKRRLFKTVAAAENIGYHEPGEIHRQKLCGDGFSRARFLW